MLRARKEKPHRAGAFTTRRATASLLLTPLLGGLVLADTPTTEAQAANITDPTAECVAYGYAPVTDALNNNEFPAIWKAVLGVSNDTEGYQRFLSINSSIPNIAPKGTDGVADPNLKYPSSDPDCWWTYSNCVTPKLSGLKPDIASVPEPKTLGYGFDDGPYCAHNAFYDYLVEQKQKATMFYIGSNVMNQPLQAQRAATDGHQICVHTWSHNSMTAFTNEGAFGELWYTLKAIKLVTGYTPTCWRPPYGDIDDRIRYIAEQLGLDTIIWKYDSNDWEEGENGVTNATVVANYGKLLSDAESGALDSVGAIILAHELTNYTMQTAIDMYPKLVAAFDYIVPVAVAMNKTQPYLETNVTFPTFAEYVASKDGSTPSSNSSGSAVDSGSVGNSKPTMSGASGSSSSTKATAKSAGIALQLTRSSGILALMLLCAVAILPS